MGPAHGARRDRSRRGLVTEAMRLSPQQPVVPRRCATRSCRPTRSPAGRTTPRSGRCSPRAGWATARRSRAPRPRAGRRRSTCRRVDRRPRRAPTVTDPAPLGDGDSRAESGETARLRIAVRNTTSAQLTGVTRDAVHDDAAASRSASRPSIYPNLAVKAIDTGNIPFAITLPTSLPCTTIVALSLAVHADQGDAVAAADARSRHPQRHEYTRRRACHWRFPTPRSPASTATANVVGAGTVDGLRVTFSTNHTFIGDLAGRLTAPDGTSAELFERPGGFIFGFGSGAAGLTAVFDDAAPSSIQDLPPWTGGSEHARGLRHLQAQRAAVEVQRALTGGARGSCACSTPSAATRADHGVQRPADPGSRDVRDERTRPGRGRDRARDRRHDGLGDAQRHASTRRPRARTSSSSGARRPPTGRSPAPARPRPGSGRPRIRRAISGLAEARRTTTGSWRGAPAPSWR